MKKLLRLIKRIADKVFGTKADEFYWRFRHILQDKTWAENYISPQALHHSHRKLLIQAIARHAPFKSVLEIGCASGPNLILLAEKFPQTELWGIDISNYAITVGKDYIKKHSFSNIHLKTGSAETLKNFPDKSFDIVFTDAVLIYIGPEKIKEVIREMVRVAKYAIILVEWCSEKPHAYEADHWAYNWKMLFVEAGISNVKISRLSDASWKGEWAKRGCVVEVRLTS